MNLKSEISASISAFAILNLVLAFGAISLFVRMGPVIDRILDENVYTVIAAEEILVELSQSSTGTPIESSRAELILTALQKAERNVTEPEEPQILEQLRKTWPSVAAGQAEARTRFLKDLGRLIEVNRSAMRRVDETARRLGTAGAWAAVLVGFLAFLLSVVVASRLHRRLILPLLDLHEVLQAARRGDRHRRCTSAVDAPPEVLAVTESVNQLLDLRSAQTKPWTGT